MTKLIKTEQEWREQLNDLDYQVTRQAATERAFTGRYWDLESSVLGVYHCVCCDTALFKSNTKFDAGCGWPSYFAAINNTVITEIEEQNYLYGMRRIEITCTRCDAHLGHVFPDGPEPTGLRYCVNGSALTFKPTV
jgi:peptide-methionine (R)-S-oxide reductase